MKILTVVATAVLLAGPAMAQSANTRQAPMQEGNAPVTQQGSGQEAGGPARELNSATGGAPSVQGTGASTTGSSNARQPTTQQSSGEQAGGPAGGSVNRQ